MRHFKTLVGIALVIGCATIASSSSLPKNRLQEGVQAEPAVDSTPGFSVSNDSILLGDGVRASVSATLSKRLIDPSTNDSVRCLSIFTVFTGRSGRLLARTTSQRVLATGSSEAISIELGGVDPRLDAAGAIEFPDATDHSYLITVSPAADTRWGEIQEEEVIIDVVRSN